MRIRLAMDSRDPGVLVTGVDAGSPADQVRFRPGDLILRANRRLLWNPDDLEDEFKRLEPGGEVSLTIQRGEEPRELVVPLAETPRGYLGFAVHPLSLCDSLRAGLPSEILSSGDLPVVTWVEGDMSRGNRHRLAPGAVIVSVDGTPVHSVDDLNAATNAIQIGQEVLLRCYHRGAYRNTSLVAQAPPRAWSGLHLEEISPLVVENESLSPADVNAGGLFLRRVGADSPAERAGLRARDQILGLNGQALSTIEGFEEGYGRIPPGQNVNLTVRHPDGGIDTVAMERGAQLGAHRVASQRRGVEVALAPRLRWTKVTGTRLGGLSSLQWSPSGERTSSLRGARDVDLADSSGGVHIGWSSGDVARSWAQVHWGYDYGFGDKRWHHVVELAWRPAWLPTIRYQDQPTPFYGEQISNPSEANFRVLFLGEDKLRYVRSVGRMLTWQTADHPWVGHAAKLTLGFLREKEIANASTSSLFGRRHFSSNPVDESIRGTSHTLTFRYSYNWLNWRAWTRMLLWGEVRLAGGLLGGDREFVRWEANATRSLRISQRFYVDSRAQAGLATGNLPPQEEFSSGGKGTLPGYGDHEFLGDRSLLFSTQLSWVPFGPPEQEAQYRVFAGLDAGKAWRSDDAAGIPRLRSDLVLGQGVFFSSNRQILFPTGVSVAWARPLDAKEGIWRFQLDVAGGASR